MTARRTRRPGLGERISRFFWPRRGWARVGRYYRTRLVRLRATPHAIAAGVAAGTFASFTPFIGLHFLLGFAIAWAVRGSMIAAALGTAIGNPLTFPLIWVATFEVGRFILSGGDHGITIDGGSSAPGSELLARGIFEVGLDRLWPILKPMMVGAVPIGLAAATIVYLATYKIVAAHQARRRERHRAERRHIVAGGVPDRQEAL